MIRRTILKRLKERMFQQKVIIITGARQVGKTTMVKSLFDQSDVPYDYWNCDEPDIRLMLTSTTSAALGQLIGNSKIIVIDEAQRVPEIGITLKLMVENFPDVQVIATGSSSFGLTANVNEPLTGRKFEYKLYPLSFSEMAAETDYLKQNRLLKHRLVYGMYPEIINNPGDETERLQQLIDSYLFKDLLSYGGLRKPEVLEKLLRALAFQVGASISYNELAQTVGVDKNTVAHYIELLIQTFVLFRLRTFSRNLRNELKRDQKIYFWDNGVRNTIIRDYKPLGLRKDVGALWENFCIAERLKLLENNRRHANSFYWRTHQKQEIDYIEEENGQLMAVELKWNPKAKFRAFKKFKETYPESQTRVVNRDDYKNFIDDEIQAE